VLYVMLLLLILLVVAVVLVAVQNYAILLTGVHLNLFSWHLPGIPLFLFCLFGIFLGGLLLYIVSTLSARRDTSELGKLRVQVGKLSEPQAKSSSGLLSNSGMLVPPVVPIPGISPTSTGPLLIKPQIPPKQNPAPSAAFSNYSVPPGPGQSPQASQMGAPRPPFFSQ
jgi:uncharacterized integral membrane protein